MNSLIESALLRTAGPLSNPAPVDDYLPPRDDWSVAMCWQNLLFAHWPVRPEALRPLIPPALELDTYDGWAWIGIVPFHLTIRYRRLPLTLSFPEVNVRTYVRLPRTSTLPKPGGGNPRAWACDASPPLPAAGEGRVSAGDSPWRGEGALNDASLIVDGQSGVWFLSLDAHSRLAVSIAHRRYALPYHFAKIAMQTNSVSHPERPAMELSLSQPERASTEHSLSPPRERAGVRGLASDVGCPAMPPVIDRGLNEYFVPFPRHGVSIQTAPPAPCPPPTGSISFSSRRYSRHSPPPSLQIDYMPTGSPFTAAPGSLEHFLTERYRLFTTDRHGQLHTGEIHHAPWQLQPAETEFQCNTMLEPLGLARCMDRPLLHFSNRINAVAWKPTTIPRT